MPYDQTVHPADDGRTDLSIIGVPLSQQRDWPTIAGFPRKFNRLALPMWADVLEDAEFVRQATALGNKDATWNLAIQEFLQRCEDVGVMPFPGNTDISQNQYVQSYVKRSRLELVNFVERVGMFKRLHVRSVYRQYTRDEEGITFHCWAELFPVLNFPDFRQWLVTSPWPRFIKTVDNKYVKVIRPNVNMWVRYLNDSRITVGYSIKVIGTVNIPGNKTPTRKEVDEYLDRTVWLPIIRAHRFRDVKNRLF